MRNLTSYLTAMIMRFVLKIYQKHSHSKIYQQTFTLLNDLLMTDCLSPVQIKLVMYGIMSNFLGFENEICILESLHYYAKNNFVSIFVSTIYIKIYRYLM